MLTYVGRRLALTVPLLLLVGLFVFLLLDLTPGDAATRVAGDNASPAEIQQVRERLGLDRNVFVRYGEWLGDAVHGDLGKALTTPQSVGSALRQRLPVTLSVALVALTFTLLIGVPLGLLAALRPNSWLDRAVTAASALAMALPPFVIGLVLVLVFAVRFRIFPASGYSPMGAGFGAWFHHIVLPGAALSTMSIAELARQLRGALVDALGNDYVRTARAKGLRERSVVGKHALKNAAVPVVTVFGLQINRLLAGSVTIEFIFVMPGFGRLAYDAVVGRDIPMIQGVVMVSALIVVVLNLLVDVLYGVLNPRLRR